jgi:TolB protein
MIPVLPARALVVLAALVTCTASAHAVPAGNYSRIAFARGGYYTQIWTADQKGRNPRPLVRFRRWAADQPAWSPSGRQVAFSLDRDPPSLGKAKIYVVRASGGTPRRLTGGRTVDTAPAWSPDGRWIAFSKATHGDFVGLGVFVMRADRGGQHRLTHNVCDDTPAWSPTGRKLVVSRCGSLYIVNADGTHARRLTTPPPPDPRNGSEFWDDQPDWSPDGRWIAFVRTEQFDRGGGDISQLYVIRRDGSGERQLTDGGDDRSPSWSPNGRLVAFASYSRIMTVTVGSGRQRTLVLMHGSELHDPAWLR